MRIGHRPFAVHFAEVSQNLFQQPSRNEFLVKDDDVPVDELQKLLKREDGLYEHRKTKKLYVPTRLRSKLTAGYHMGERGGHQSVTETHRNMSGLFWWPRSKEFAQHFVQECAICARNLVLRNLPRTHEGTPEQPFFMSRVSMDYVGPRAFQGQGVVYAHKGILVCIHHPTLYIVARATLVKTAAVTRNLFAESVVGALGICDCAHTDATAD